jgi:hypothetical protein
MSDEFRDDLDDWAGDGARRLGLSIFEVALPALALGAAFALGLLLIAFLS